MRRTRTHPDARALAGRWAHLRRITGDYQGAATVYRQQLRLAAGERDLSDPELQELTLAMGRMHEEAGHELLALPAAERVLSVRRETLGESAPQTLETAVLHADLLYQVGEREPSLKDARAVIAPLQKQGKEDPLAFRDFTEIALLLAKDGEIEEARALALDCVENTATAFENGHPLHIKSQLVMASILSLTELPEDALSYAQSALEATQEWFPPNHPAVPEIERIHALLLHQTARTPDDAERLAAQVHHKLKASLGNDHLETLRAAQSLAYLWGKQKRYQEALDLYTEVGKAFERQLGPLHPLTLKNRFTLATIHEQTGFFDTTRELLDAVLKDQMEVLERTHPDLRETWRAVYRVYQMAPPTEEAQRSRPDTRHLDDLALEVGQAFLAAQSVEEKLALVAEPDRVKPLMEA